METQLAPSEAQIATLMALPPESPVAVLNLFQFNPVAKYQPGDPEFGTADADVSGEEAYRRYGAVAGKGIEDLGGRMVMAAGVDQIMIGPEGASWDLAAIMYFPSRAAFMEMLADPAFQDNSRHRKAALANHYMLHLQGESF